MSAAFPMQALIRRELRVSLRQVRTFAMLLLIASGSIGLVLWQWNDMMSGLSAVDLQRLAAGGGLSRLSLRLLDSLAIGLALGSCVFVPGLAAASLTSEKEQDTLDLIRLTLIPHWGVVVGKLINAMGIYLLIVLSVLPITGVLFFTAGVDTSQLLFRFAGILSITLTCASIGLLCSAALRQTTVALIAAYVAVATAFGGPLALLWLFVDLFEDFAVTWDWNFASGWQRTLYNGIFLMDGRIEGIAAYILPWGALDNDFRPMFYQVALSVNALLLTHALLRRTPKPRIARQHDIIDDGALLDHRRNQFPYYLIDPKQRARPIPDASNPMLIKELRWGLLGRMNRLVRLFYGSFIAFVVIASAVQFTLLIRGEAAAALAACIAIMAVVLAIIPALLANTFSKEREQGNLDLLRMTLLNPRQIILGKTAAGLLTTGPLLAAALLVFFLLSAVNLVLWGSTAGLGVILRAAGTLLVCVLLALTLSLAASLRARHSSTAIASGYTLVLIVFFGFSAVAHPILTTLRKTDTSGMAWYQLREHHNTTAELVSLFSPLLSFVQPVRYETRYIFETWAVSATAFLLIAAGIFVHSIFYFRRRWMREDTT